MNINRNNYEEYFLLYADKELSAEEKTRVETFVQENPDLEEEFVMLQQSVTRPDKTIVFEDKKSLFREEGTVNENNYQEKFLLYTDNELTLSETGELEKFLVTNPALQHEFKLLQKVTYEPDTSIVFPDKNLLYKKDDEHKVIPFPWRYLAAAVLLGIGLWTGLPYLQNDKVKPAVAIKEPTPKENAPVNVNVPNENVKDQQANNDKKQNDKQVTPSDKNVQDKLVQKQPQENVTVKNIQPGNKKSEVTNEPVNKEQAIAIADVTEKTTPKTNGLPQPINKITEPTSNTVSTPVVENNSKVLPAAYIEDADAKSENYVFFNISAEEFRKSKIGNFLKRAKRSIAGKLSLRNGLRIGNVEIAKDDQN
jgi:hypothetical protein